MSAVVEIDRLHAGYAGVPAVRDLSLTVGEGEVVALLGPNGAGKTTTLLAAAGILPIMAGDVRVLGRSVRREHPHSIARRGLSLVPEDRGLFQQLTVRENLRLARRRGRGVALTDVLSHFPALEGVLDHRAGLLSGGEQQMLALAKALVSQPRVLMVDEMSLGLAPVVVERLLPFVRQISETAGVAVLLVEQHVHIALTVADRAYVLSRGQLVLEGPAAQIRKRPDLLEASYLGGTLTDRPAVKSSGQTGSFCSGPGRAAATGPPRGSNEPTDT